MLLFGAAMGATTVSAQSSDGEVAVSPTDVSLSQGESQTIAVTYERESNATPQGIEYTLTYDPAVISVTDQAQGSYLGGTALINNVSTPGEVEYAEVALDGDGAEAASGTIAEVTIEAASDVDNRATTTLEFTTAKASEGSTEFAITTTDGTVETEAPDPTDGSSDEDSDTEETTDEDSNSEETTDEDSDTEETTDEDSNSEETTDEDATNEEIAADDSEANDNETTGKEDNTATTNETTTEAELNETENTEPNQSTKTEQTATDSSTNETSTSEGDTNDAVPGFGIELVTISILIISYIIGHRKY